MGTFAAADPATALADEVVASLVYEQVLGQGTFKTVFSVSSPLLEGRWALAVERMDTQDALREELHGIEVAQELQRTLPRDDRARFEQVSAWWMQKTAVNPFNPGAVVLAPGSEQARFTSQPRGVFKPVFLLALKPIYVTDLEALRKKGLPSKFATFDDQGALRLALDMCKAGRILHQHGFVHRDIKPKNVMLDAEGSAVLIDFGFSSGAQQTGADKRVCAPGFRGELSYVLASDVWALRGCQQGDLYAMGKTLFETFFELAENDGDAASTPRGVEPEALKFARAAAISTPEPTTPPGGTGESDLWSTLLPPPIARLPLFRRADTSPKSGFATDSPEGGAGLFVALAGVKKQGKQAFVTGAAAEELNQAFRAKIWAADASKGRSRFHLTPGTADVLLRVIRGLCDDTHATSFAEAEAVLEAYNGRGSL